MTEQQKIPKSSFKCADDRFIAKELLKLAKGKEGGKFLEVGVYRGMTLVTMLESSGMLVTGVDRWEGFDGYNQLSTTAIEELPGYYFWLQKHYGFRCRLIRASSAQAANYFLQMDEKFDMIFIDADHRYEAVVEDLENYSKLLTEDGIFSGHDYLPGRRSRRPAVNRAVDEFAASRNWKVRTMGARVWYMER